MYKTRTVAAGGCAQPETRNELAAGEQGSVNSRRAISPRYNPIHGLSSGQVGRVRSAPAGKEREKGGAHKISKMVRAGLARVANCCNQQSSMLDTSW
jgi:hypothetical protein